MQDIQLKINGDPSGLIASVKAAMAQMQKDFDKLNINPGMAKQGGSSGYQTPSQTHQSNRAQEQKSRAEQDALKVTVRGLAEIDRQLAINARTEAKGDRAKIDIEKEKVRLLERQKQLQGELNTAQGKTSAGGTKPPSSGGANGVSLGKGGVTSLSGLGNALGLPVAGIATAIAGTLALEGIRKFYSQADNRARVTGASAFNTQGQAGQLLSSAFSGGAPEDLMFAQQRSQAFQIARTTQNANVNSFARGVTHPQEFINYIGLGTADTKRESQNKRDIEEANIQAEQYEAIKNGSDGKIRTEVSNKYLRDSQRNLQFQRQTGLSEDGFRRFLGGINGSGFSDEQGMGMSSTIMGAGGGTRASMNSGFALQMGRQFDLTNAGQAMGSIGSQLGSQQMSKEGLIAVQAEGTRLGLNRSDMREENRRFVEMAAGVIGQSNATSGAGVDQVLEMLTRSMSGATTVSGLEAGKGAYDAYQRQSNIQSGPSAAMRSAGMRGDSVLGKLSERDRAKLSMMPESEINSDNKMIQAMARDGASTEQIVKNYHGVIGRSLFVNPSTDKAISNLKNSNFAMSPRDRNKLQGEAMGEISLEQFGKGMTYKQLEQATNMLSSGDYEGPSKLKEGVKNGAESNKSPRPGDETEKQQAEVSRMANELFTSIQKDIQATAAQTAIFTANINALVTAMKGGDAASIAAAQKNLYNLTPRSPMDQTHASSGGAPPSYHLPSWSN